MSKRPSSCELSTMNPGWIHKVIEPQNYDEEYKRILQFYVVNTPCEKLSTSSLPLSHYGWGSKVWKNDELKKKLFEVAGLCRETTFVVAKTLEEMKSSFEKTSLKKHFHSDRDTERVAVYKSNYNEFLAICYHIRNSLAHGRFQMYTNSSNEVVFAMEDGIKQRDKFEVRSRMILKKSTLIKWIDILERNDMEESA